MKNSNKKSKLVGLLLVVAVMASGNVFSQRMHRNFNQDGMRFNQNSGQGRMWNQQGQRGMLGLDLTEDQMTKVKELRTKNLKEMQPIRNLMQEKKARMRTLTTSETFNQKEVDKVVDEITELTSKQMKLRIAHRQEFRSLLTDEQRVIFDSSPRHGQRQLGNRNARTGKGVHARPGFRSR
mgnify:CR=1 FL=1